MKRYLFLFGLCMAISRYADSEESKEPAELTALRKSYNDEIAKVMTPINARYIEALVALKKKLCGAGDLDGALMVQSELKAITESINDGKSAAMLGGAKGKWNSVVVKATDAHGTKLGSFKKGQKISLRYVDGLWTGNMHYPMRSPDAEDNNGGCNLINGNGAIVVTIPGNTKNKPFEYVLIENETLMLRIADQGALTDNAGRVTYEFQVQ